MDNCTVTEGHVAWILSPLSGGLSPNRVVKYDGTHNPFLSLFLRMKYGKQALPDTIRQENRE
jgi:hypothetical protein